MHLDPKTHPDFKSLCRKVKNAADLHRLTYNVFGNQKWYKRQTTEEEESQWTYDALQSLEIDPEMIDRLYYIRYRHEIIARIRYEGEPLYVNLYSYCVNDGLFCRGSHGIFVSRNAHLFLRMVSIPNRKRNLVHESLAEDGIRAENRVPALKYLCHEAVYSNETRLRSQISQLPKVLVNSIENFVKTNAARKICQPR